MFSKNMKNDSSDTDSDEKNDYFYDDKKQFSQMSVKELKQFNNPIVRAKVINEDKKVYAEPRDKIKCNICGGIFTRSNRWAHKKTKLHQAYESMNDRIRRLLLEK